MIMADDSKLLEAELLAAADEAEGGSAIVTIGNTRRRVELRFDPSDGRATLAFWWLGDRGDWLRVKNGGFTFDSRQLSELARGIATALQLAREARDGRRR
jgi:hypothetical protein